MFNQNYEKQGYLLEDFRLFHLNSAAGMRTGYHYHEFCKLLLLISGTGSYWIGGMRYALQPGDIVLVGDGCVHRPEFEPGTVYERMIFYISPAFLRRASTPECDLTECFTGNRGYVLRAGQGGFRLFHVARELERELSEGAYGSAIVASGLLLRLLVQISRGLRRGEVLQPGSAAPKDGRVRQIMAYIDSHLTEELSVDAVADRFYLSKFHMMRLFRAATGTSVNGYITQRRLEYARKLIAAGMSATESCFRSGFGSYSSFTRTYGKYFGTTPTGRPYAAPMRDAEDE